MIRIRRHDHSPRIELLPMIDVVFLLLTFFIFSMVMMVRAQVLPVDLVPVATGEAATQQHIRTITIDRHGQLHLDRQPIAPDALQATLVEMAQQDPHPALYLALEQTSTADEAFVDRGPMLTQWIQRVRASGIEQFSIVGPAEEDASPTTQ